MSFVSLHIHSDYSLLDGASQIPQLIDRCLELDMKRVANTDASRLSALVRVWA